MRNKKRIYMLIVSALLVGSMSFSVYAATNASGSASASSRSAYAYVSSSTTADLSAVARMSNSIGWTGDSVSNRCTYLSASANASDLPSGDIVRTSRASATADGVVVAEDYWSA